MMKSIFKGMFVLAALALPTTINAQKLHYNAGLETSHLWRGLEVSKGLTFNNEFAASSCHCFLGHEVGHPQEDSPQA